MVLDANVRTGNTDDHSSNSETFHIMEIHIGTAGWLLGLLAVITAIGAVVWWWTKRCHRKRAQRREESQCRELVPYRRGAPQQHQYGRDGRDGRDREAKHVRYARDVVIEYPDETEGTSASPSGKAKF